MKTTNTKGMMLALLMLSAAAASAFASGKLTVSPYLKTNYAIVSAIVSTSTGARLAIKDSDGTVLYRSSKIDNSESFQKLLDVSALENGTYKVYLEGKSVKEVSEFSVIDNRLVTNSTTARVEKSSSMDAAYFRKSDDMISVTHLNPELNTSHIAIYDNRGETVYSSELPIKETFSARYSINTLPRGQYTVALTSGSKTHSYDFAK